MTQYQGFGLGLRPKHYPDVIEGGSSVSWYEVVTENFLGDGGRPLSILEKIRHNYSIAFHGVSGSLGSTDRLNDDLGRSYYRRLRNLIDRFEPFIVSDHCCWTRVGGQSFHDLLPLPFTREAAKHVASRISKVQDWLGRKILIENVSSYLSFAQDEMTEWEFLTEILETADCGLLLDVNNIYVSSVNHGFDPLAYLNGLPKARVGQIHLAGHSTKLTAEGRMSLRSGAFPGQVFFESSTNLSGWKTVAGPLSTNLWTSSSPATEASRFYRIRGVLPGP